MLEILPPSHKILPPSSLLSLLNLNSSPMCKELGLLGTTSNLPTISSAKPSHNYQMQLLEHEHWEITTFYKNCLRLRKRLLNIRQLVVKPTFFVVRKRIFLQDLAQSLTYV